MSNDNTEYLGFRLPPGTKDSLKELATSMSRSRGVPVSQTEAARMTFDAGLAVMWDIEQGLSDEVRREFLNKVTK
jgi:predicted transcriptional regulator